MSLYYNSIVLGWTYLPFMCPESSIGCTYLPLTDTDTSTGLQVMCSALNRHNTNCALLCSCEPLFKKFKIKCIVMYTDV